MSLLVASLYLLCLAFLFGSALYVYSRDPFDQLNSSFALLALTLLGWVGTLFVFTSEVDSSTLLWLGRANFAAAALAAPVAWHFVQALAQQRRRPSVWLWGEVSVVALLSLLTGSVDRVETVQAGVHITTYGWLFPLYVVHILFFTLLALRTAFQSAPHFGPQTRIQLRLVGLGIFATVTVGFVADALLPYVYGNFRYIHVGTLSTIFFLAAIAYAASVHHLFNVRVLLRATFIFTALIAFALELYQIAVEFLTHLLPLGDPSQRHIAAATIALIVNAFTHEPLRWQLELLADKFMKQKSRRTHIRK